MKFEIEQFVEIENILYIYKEYFKICIDIDLIWYLIINRFNIENWIWKTTLRDRHMENSYMQLSLKKIREDLV